MVARLALALLLTAPAAGQVRQSQTISAAEGGFAGPLSDGDRFGVSAAGLGDLDGDGTPDLAVGAYHADGRRGAVWILLLQTDGTVRASREVRLAETAAGDQFGTALAALGDLDGDGHPEIAVGADHADDGGTDRGAVWIVSLGLDGTVRSAQAISTGRGGLTDPPADGDLFGHSVAALGDVDGDGTTDLAVGGDDAGDGGPLRGAVWVLLLRPDGTVRATQRISSTAGGFTGTIDDGDFFGQSVAGIGDLDGDGIPDLAVGATRDDDGSADVGAVWVLFLNRDGTVRQHQKISATAGGFGGALAAGDVFGSSLVAPGDLDRDGVPDLIVGAGGDDDGGPDRGAAWVVFLRADGTARDQQKLSSSTGGATGAFADGDEWSPTAALGDLDGDGAADLVLGSRLSDAGGRERGAARVLFTGYAVATALPPASGGVRLEPPAPNPARSVARVRFSTAAAGPVSLTVTDALGRDVAAVVRVDAPAGPHQIIVDVGGWAPGVYLVRLRSGRAQATARLVVVR